MLTLKLIVLVASWIYHLQKLLHNLPGEPSMEDISQITELTEFDIQVQHTHSRLVTFRNLKQINVSQFQSMLDFSNIDNWDDLQSVYN